MIQRTCDGCGDPVESSRPGDIFEITKTDVASKDLTRIRVRVIVDVDGTSNGGEVCERCIRNVVRVGQVRRG